VSDTCVSADSVALSSSRQRFVSMCCCKGLLLLGGRRFTGLVTVITTAFIMKLVENCKATKVLNTYRRHFGAKLCGVKWNLLSVEHQ
jgi:hypothetical protein